ncbi:MAG: alkaline phosphatase D family protein [Lacunisphaera sp.]|nr:alkaline phosphatase D family protein [Lacunisphaera sp.]
MKNKITRREALKYLTVGTIAGSIGNLFIPAARGAPVPATGNTDEDQWSRTHDRVWLGGAYWANPMEDWCIKDGWAECLSTGGNRSIHSLTHEMTDPAAGFMMSVRLERVAFGGKDEGAGFRLGVRSELNEYRSNCFERRGVNAVVVNGRLILGSQSAPLTNAPAATKLDLHLTGRAEISQVSLTLEARSSANGAVLGRLTHAVPAESLLGNVSLVTNSTGSPDKRPGKQEAASGSRFRFSRWTLAGDAFTVRPERSFGPLLWSMYSLSDSRGADGFVLKLSALTGPMGAADSQVVEFKVRRGGAWQSLGEAPLNTDAWLATFRIPNWDAAATTPFQLVYREKHRDGTMTPHLWTGTIAANPQGRPLRMAALTCQNDYGFPYEPVATNVAKLKPDLVFFSGDQIYETHGGFGFIREPEELAILNYLRKFYQFGWAFREVMRHQPTLCLPDDHDVLQGNLWGQGGAKMQNLERDYGASILGGYAEPPRMVNVVHRTNTAHHPDPFDPTPVEQGISSYYGDMVYGEVGFAIIADRQWKSGPEKGNVIVGKEYDKDVAGKIFDRPALSILGERQETFLKQWAEDWRGHKLKTVLSQTLFASLSTHQPRPDRYLKFDFDSNSWPQTPRNRAVALMRPSMALHICGDTHLASLAQYGVQAQRDSNWAFCTPAIAAGWPRWWLPDDAGMPHTNRPQHGLPNTGEYLDAFENRVYVYAVGNPVVGQAPNRYDKAHEKGSGFGFITFDLEKLTYLVESFRFRVDVLDGKRDNQFPGWPVTIHQQENNGQNRLD